MGGTTLIDASAALPGRATPLPVTNRHAVLGTPIKPPFPVGMRRLVVGMGCFWGAERRFWELGTVYTTAVGYAGGFTQNPTYEEVCANLTGHVEVVLVVHDPTRVALDTLLRVFWESHDPTQGMRQGGDVGTQYRSAIYVEDDAALEAARASRTLYAQALAAGGIHRQITTEIALAPAFYYAEDYHQQYLAKNPRGYCGLGGTGVSCPAPR
jgi:peptide-methionine (S)-S-oxide reductase